jgi:hypothetical protein
MNIDLHYILIFAGFAVTLLGAIACIILGFCQSGWKKRAFLFIAAVALLAPSALVTIALKSELVDARFRTFKKFYSDIHVGMTRAEVMTLLSRHYPLNGKRHAPTIQDNPISKTESRLDFVMNPEDSTEPNCEWIFLEMRDDKVQKKDYSPD